jgi:hypothetical protein
MFGLADLVTVGILQDTFTFLANNPKHLEFILGGFTNYEVLRRQISPEHMSLITEFISENKIHITPYLEADISRTPAIYVVSEGGEDIQVIGDMGLQDQYSSNSCVINPMEYAHWTSSRYSDDEMIVSSSYELKKKLWRNVFIRNGSQIYQLRGIRDDGTETVLYLDRPVDTNLPLVGWVAQSDERAFGCDLGFSADGVEVKCMIQSTGDFQVHRILQIIVRYAIKKNRLNFINHNMQLASVSYSIPNASGDVPNIFTSYVNMRCTCTEHWIQREYALPDRSMGVEVEVVANRGNEYDISLGII